MINAHSERRVRSTNHSVFARDVSTATIPAGSILLFFVAGGSGGLRAKGRTKQWLPVKPTQTTFHPEREKMSRVIKIVGVSTFAVTLLACLDSSATNAQGFSLQVGGFGISSGHHRNHNHNHGFRTSVPTVRPALCTHGGVFCAPSGRFQHVELPWSSKVYQCSLVTSFPPRVARAL